MILANIVSCLVDGISHIECQGRGGLGLAFGFVKCHCKDERWTDWSSQWVERDLEAVTCP